jgi:DNA-binding XRE family transcriptional regulator
MGMSRWTREQRRRAKERATKEWRERVLASPETYSPLKVARTKQNLTQAQLGDLPSVRLHRRTISSLEREISAGTSNSRARIGYALGIDPAELFPQ